MIDDKKGQIDGVGAAKGEKELEATKTTTPNGGTELGDLNARVDEELAKIGSGGPWVWCVFILIFIYLVFVRSYSLNTTFDQLASLTSLFVFGFGLGM